MTNDANAISHSRPTVEQEDVDAVVGCLKSHHIAAGKIVALLEETVAADSGYRYAVATVNGSQALHLGLRALLPGGGRVGLQSYLCRSVYDAIALAGCQPVLSDLHAASFRPAFDDASQQGLDAVLVPHLFGIRTPVETYLDSGPVVIEDCAQRVTPGQAVASETRPPLRILSFSATKLLTGGEGGILLVDDEALYRRALRLRDAPYDFPEPACWLPYTDLQAALVAAQWRRKDDFLKKRRELAQLYLRALGDSLAHWIVPAMWDDTTHHFRFVLRVPHADSFIAAGAERGVIFRRPVAPLALHRLFGVGGDFPVTDEAMAHVVSIPIYPELSHRQAQKIVDVVQQSAELAHGS